MAVKPVIPALHEFASRCKDIRENRKLSQTGMSQLCDCALPTIQDVEASKMPLPGKSFIKLYDEGYDLNWLVGGGNLKMLRKDNLVEAGQFRPELMQRITEEIWKVGQGILPETAGRIATMLYTLSAGADNLDNLPSQARQLIDMIRTVK